jgi:hypothetical protein
VYPDAFQGLVDHRAGGIRTGALAADLQRRGWTAIAGPGNETDATREIRRGRPVIALIEDSPGRYHYVVIVGWESGTVTVHDPARAPSRALPAARFDAEWKRSERWMLIVLPPPSPATPRADERAAADLTGGDRGESADACTSLVSEGIARASTDRGAARAALTRATAECPGSGAAWRELAGLDALDADWPSAATAAQRAVFLAPHDDYAWRILATADYLRHDDLGALAAWNRTGGPAVSLIDVTGLERTRYGVVAGAISVPLKSTLTPEALRLAERRLHDVPSIAAARVAFHPVENDRVQVDASVLERDRAPWGYPAWLAMGFDAAANRQVSAVFSSMTGGGEAAGVTWRWWENRPMIAGFFAVPAPAFIAGGSVRLDASRETQTFGTTASAQTRARVAMTFARWMTDRTRVTAGAGADRWSDRPGDATLSYGIEHWRFDDRVRLSAAIAQAIGSAPFTAGSVAAAARTKASYQGLVLSGVAGYGAASAASPLSIWPGADTGHASDILLRAHPLLENGIVTGGVFGRQLAFATVEAQRWQLLRRAPVRIAPAVFTDLARAWHGLDGSRTPLQIDAGIGLRLALPGAGTMRIDLARGLADGHTAVSAGWDLRWR